jgi:hypothetical protein
LPKRLDTPTIRFILFLGERGVRKGQSRYSTDNLLPELTALLADVTAQLDRVVSWEEARQAMTRRLQAAAHAEVDDPLARAAVSAICHHLVRKSGERIFMEEAAGRKARPQSTGR